MVPPLISESEAQRLVALDSYAVLDTLPESDFDALAEAAAGICEAPIALISLIDRDRQWFKARVGFPLKETAREISFCGHALYVSDLFVVPDTTRDERFADNPLVTGAPGIRFYAGVVLRTKEGDALGTLCVMDRVPRQLSSIEEIALKKLAHQVMAQLDIRRRARESRHNVDLSGDILDSLTSKIAVLGPDGNIVRVNAAWRRLAAEHSTEDDDAPFVGQGFLAVCERVHLGGGKGWADACTAGICAVQDHLLPEFYLEYACHSPRRHRWFHLTVTPSRGSVGVVVVQDDCTERKIAELKLRASLKDNFDLRAAFDEHCVVATTDARGRITFVNDRFCALSKYSREELVGLELFRFMSHPKEMRSELWATIHCGRVWNGETKNRAKDGVSYWMDTTIVPFLDDRREVRQFTVICADVTERRQAEEALENSQRLLSDIIEHSGSLVLVKDKEGYYQLVNRKWEEVTGLSREDVLGKTDAEVFPGITGERFRQVDIATMNFGQSVTTEETLTDGTRQRHFISVKFPLRDGRGKVSGIGAMIAETTAIKEVESTVREQAALLDKARDAILVRSIDNKITYWNKSAERLYGWTQAEVMGLAAEELLYANVAGFQDVTKAVIEKGEWVGEIEQWTKDGRHLVAEARWTLVRDGKGDPECIFCINTDVTDRKNLEQQFLRAQRLESIGTLAGGIAHDLNNVLGPIVLSLDVLRMRFPDRESDALLSTIASSARRGADMVQQVLQFGRGVDGQRLPLRFEDVLQDTSRIVNSTFLKHIAVSHRIAPDLWPIIGDATQLHQVLLNLCVNARDAMPEGGNLGVVAENIVFDEHYAALNLDAAPGPYVLIEVRDDGHGIPSGVMEKIFDPFFTTKDVGKGTGLGLSTVLAIVKSHGGFIRVFSEPGKGASFKVYLPARPGESTVDPEPQEPEMPRGSGETILVVDDEGSVRIATERTLQTFGYQVLSARDGTEAIALFAAHAGQVAAVLTDMVMPNLDGVSLIRALRKMKPSLPIIVASGLSTNEQIASAAALGVKEFIPKPYTAERLLKALRQAL